MSESLEQLANKVLQARGYLVVCLVARVPKLPHVIHGALSLSTGETLNGPLVYRAVAE